MDEVADIFIIDDRYNSGLTPFARSNGDAFAFKVNVAYIKFNQLMATKRKPPEDFDNAPITEIGRGKYELLTCPQA